MNNKTIGMLAILGCLIITQNKNIQAYEVKSFNEEFDKQRLEAIKNMPPATGPMKSERTPTGFKVFLKNDTIYGIAHPDKSGNLRILNICSTEVQNCTVGKVSVESTIGGALGLNIKTVGEMPLGEKIVRLSIQEPGKQEPTDINSGETKQIAGEGNQVNIIAYYGARPLKFTAPVPDPSTPGPMAFPQDFTMVQ